MLDELPMLWSAVFFLFTALTLGDPPGSTRSTVIGLLLVAYAAINSMVYFAGGFVYFIIAYVRRAHTRPRDISLPIGCSPHASERASDV